MKKIIITSLGLAAIQLFSIANATAAEPYCREYTQTFTIGNQTQKGYGTACLQPDGSWEIQKPASAPAAAAPGQVVVDQQPITYVVRENRTYVVPARPYREEVVIIGSPRYGRHHRW